MMTTKEFKTYSEQLSILEDRGLIVVDRPTAIEHLKGKNYYRLSAYSLTMRTKNPKTGAEEFYPKSTFEQIIDLYDFDNELRKIILSATTVIETNLKSYLAYYLAEKYGPLSYLNNQYFENPWHHSKMLGAFSKSLEQRKDEPFIKHHHDDLNQTYPIWVIVEICTFNQISLMYRNLLPGDRSAIAKKYYNIASREYIQSWIHSAVVARNIAAHGSRFYNRSSMNPPVKLPQTMRSAERRPFGYIYALYHLLPQENRPGFLSDIQAAFTAHPYALPRHLGLPVDWMLQIANNGLQVSLSTQ